MQREGGIAMVACCGILVGLAMLTRAFGVPIAFGILVATLVHRAWRQLLVFLGCVAPFFAALCWRVISVPPPVSPLSGAAESSLGWINTWAYYTSYLNIWKVGVPNASILVAMLKNNALMLLYAPAGYFLSPSLDRDNLLGRVLVTVVTTAIAGAVLRETLARRSRPIHFVLPFYASVVLLWNYPQADRFLIPFIPLFAAGIWLEGKHVLEMVRATITGARPVAEKVFAVTFGTIIFAFIFALAVNYSGGMRKLAAETGEKRGALMPEKLEAYQWLSRFTPPNVRVVAYEDGSLYLYSGRQAVRPFTFTTAELFDPARLATDIEHITDVPRAINAEYWVFSDDDYGLEWRDLDAKAHARMRELQRALPLAFRSDKGHVLIYLLGCTQHPEDSSCKSARNVLFPAGSENSTFGAILR